MPLTQEDGTVLDRTALDALLDTADDPEVVLAENIYVTEHFEGVDVEATSPEARSLLWPAGKVLRQSQIDAAYSAPTVSAAATPAGGAAAGGTTVLVHGSGFSSGGRQIGPGGLTTGGGEVTGVTFGGQAATDVVVLDDSTLRCVTPAHAAGAVTVAVTTGAGSGNRAATYTYA